MLKNGELYHPPIVHPDAERKQRERTTKRLIAQAKWGGDASRPGAPPQSALRECQRSGTELAHPIAQK